MNKEARMCLSAAGRWGLVEHSSRLQVPLTAEKSRVPDKLGEGHGSPLIRQSKRSLLRLCHGPIEMEANYFLETELSFLPYLPLPTLSRGIRRTDKAS